MRYLLQAILLTGDPKAARQTEDFGRVLQLVALGPLVGVGLLLGINIPSVQVVIWGSIIGPGCLAGVGFAIEELGKMQGTEETP